MADQKGLIKANLIKPTGRDRLLTRVEDLKKNPPAVGSEYEYYEYIQDFPRLFSRLCWKYFGLSSVQQSRLTKEDSVLMAEEILVKARQEIFWCRVLTLPSIGLVWLSHSDATEYASIYGALKKRYGNNCFPYQRLQEFLKQDIETKGYPDDDLADEDDLEGDEDLTDD